MLDWTEIVSFMDDAPTRYRVAVSVILVVTLAILRFGLHELITQRVRDLRKRYLWRQTINYLILFGGVAGLLLTWSNWFKVTLGYLSLIAAALTIISKELLLNFIAYWVILWREIFSVGDRIQIGVFAGDVMEVGPLYVSISEVGGSVHIDEPTGRLVKIPNSLVLTQPISNYTRGLSLVWHEMTFEVALTSNWKLARQIAEEIISEVSYRFTEADLREIRHSSEEMMFARRDPKVFIQPRNDRIRVIMRFSCKFHKRRATEERVWQQLLDRFEQEPDLQFFGPGP